jgi:hypothetical protein
VALLDIVTDVEVLAITVLLGAKQLASSGAPIGINVVSDMPEMVGPPEEQVIVSDSEIAESN